MGNKTNIKSNTKEFIEKSFKIHGDLYLYDNFVYGKNKDDKGIITCKIHGDFNQSPGKHLQGRGCPTCANKKRNTKSNKEKFVEKAKLIHGESYNYKDFEYIDRHTKGMILCLQHDIIFHQTPGNHLSGQGCRQCGKDKIKKSLKDDLEKFIEKAEKIHGDLYNYDYVIYVSSREKVKISCKMHGIFNQKPNYHLQGNGCPKCSHQISKPETKWLDYLNVPVRQYSIQTNNRKISVDGYDPSTETVYQFHGDYWHGNPDVFNPNDMNKTTKCKFKELYERTLKTDELIRNSGYKLVTIWENDYRKENLCVILARLQSS